MTAGKIIFSDLDGTLLNRESKVSIENSDAIIKALDLGHQFYIATGRPYCFAKDIANKIDPRIHVLAFNGAVYEVDRDVCTEFINEDDFIKLKNVLDKMNTVRLYKTDQAVYYDGQHDLGFTYEHLGIETIAGSEHCPKDKLLKVLVHQGDLDEQSIVELVNVLQESFEISYYKDKGFELVKKGVTKGYSITQVMQTLKKDIKEAIVFGDDTNDTSMFELDCIKVATDNAVETIKNLADYTSVHCDESAITHTLKELDII